MIWSQLYNNKVIKGRFLAKQSLSIMFHNYKTLLFWISETNDVEVLYANTNIVLIRCVNLHVCVDTPTCGLAFWLYQWPQSHKSTVKELRSWSTIITKAHLKSIKVPFNFLASLIHFFSFSLFVFFFLGSDRLAGALSKLLSSLQVGRSPQIASLLITARRGHRHSHLQHCRHSSGTVSSLFQQIDEGFTLLLTCESEHSSLQVRPPIYKWGKYLRNETLLKHDFTRLLKIEQEKQVLGFVWKLWD